MKEKRKWKLPWWVMKGNKGLDTNLIVIVIFLLVFGLIMVYSASYYKCSMTKEFNYDSMHFLKKQTIMSVFGVGVMMLVSHIDYHLYKKKWVVMLAFVLAMGLTMLLKIPAISITANGATRWLKFGPISFQVAEPVKIAVIVITAWLINRYVTKELKWKKMTWKQGWPAAFWILLPAVFLSGFLGVISNNMSSALIIGLIAFAVYFAWHPKYWPFFAMIALGVVVAFFVIRNLSADTVIDAEEGFRMMRIRAWLDPYSYESEESYQSLQALYAIGSGGLFGKGLGNSIQKLGSVPEPYNDFIFSIVCEELGIMGACVLMLMFSYLLYRIYLVAQSAEDIYGRMLATGVFSHIALQVVMNVAVVTATMPNTGVTLPFISYGGTAVVFLLIEMGMVLSVNKWGENKRIRDRRMARES